MGSHEWKVPHLQKQRWVKKWLMAFFDSDSAVTRVNKDITLELVNQAGLRQMRKFLEADFGIYSHLNYRKNRENYMLRICGKENL